MQPGRPIRCAIYTRKSSEEGLEQDYNSLHGQRDACAAYVMSQAGEGWTLLPEVYDDGGFSGGNIDRPALRRLMAEIEAKRVDVVVVYKVDRLTRSLPDFSKVWTNKPGVSQGGRPIERGGAYHMLRNPVYVGDIPHKNEVYPGQHTGPIDRETFHAVQALLEQTLTKRKTPGQPRPAHTGAPLGGLVFDSAGHVMSPVSAPRKGGATYRYYVSTTLQKGKPDTAGGHGRIPAPAIEAAILNAIGPLLPADQAASWPTIRDVIERVDLARDEAVVRLDELRCAIQFSTDAARMTLDRLERIGDAPVLRLPLTTTRRGALAMAGPDGAKAITRRPVDPALGAALVRAEAWKRKLMCGEAPTLSSIAKDEGVTDGYAARLIRVAFLAPDLKRAIFDGEQPASMTLQSVTTRDMPIAWVEQRRLYA